MSGLRMAPARNPRGQAAHIAWEAVGDYELVVVVLPYATAAWAEWVNYDASPATLARVVLRAARFFSGSPHWLVFEEPDCRVVGCDGRVEGFSAPWPVLAHHLWTGLKVRTRPTVLARNLINTLWGHVSAPGIGVDLDKANERLVSYLASEVHQEQHPRWRPLTVAAVLAQERRWLQPLPDDLEVLDSLLIAAEADDVLEAKDVLDG